MCRPHVESGSQGFESGIYLPYQHYEAPQQMLIYRQPLQLQALQLPVGPYLTLPLWEERRQVAAELQRALQLAYSLEADQLLAQLLLFFWQAQKIQLQAWPLETDQLLVQLLLWQAQKIQLQALFRRALQQHLPF
eukprot:s296_g21.t1